MALNDRRQMAADMYYGCDTLYEKHIKNIDELF